MTSHPPTMLYVGKDGVDPITHRQVQCTIIDYQSTLWSFENCTCVRDRPYTVKTTVLTKPSYMYSYLKLLPGMYICTVKGTHRPNCHLELIQREKDGDNDDTNNWKNRVLRRQGTLCANTTEIKLLNTGDTDVELRITFDAYADVRQPSFVRMEVRSRQKIAIAMKTHIHSGMYKPKPLRYDSMDIHTVLKKVHYTLHWLETLESSINSVLRMLTNPLWDIDEPTSAFDYTHFTQDIQNALSIEMPLAFLAKSHCFSIFLFEGVKVPMLSNSLVTELTQCINATSINKHKMMLSLRHGLKYINFMTIEYIEFKNCLTEKLVSLKNKADCRWNVIRVAV